jgi:hypothetical protein
LQDAPHQYQSTPNTLLYTISVAVATTDQPKAQSKGKIKTRAQNNAGGVHA